MIAFVSPINTSAIPTVVEPTAFRERLRTLVDTSRALEESIDTLTVKQIRSTGMAMRQLLLHVQWELENVLVEACIQAGELRLPYCTARLADVLSEVQAYAQAILAERQQSLRVEMQTAIRTLLVDPRRLRQAIVNLIAEASAERELGAQVVLTIRSLRAGIRFVVQGMAGGRVGRQVCPPEAVARDSSQARVSAARLWIAAAIAAAHGGRLEVYPSRRARYPARCLRLPARCCGPAVDAGPPGTG